MIEPYFFTEKFFYPTSEPRSLLFNTCAEYRGASSKTTFAFADLQTIKKDLTTNEHEYLRLDSCLLV